MSNNDGGPAFPQPMRDADGNWIGDFGPGGMSLRGYFAAKALVGYRMNTIDWKVAPSESVASWAYTDADAMLAERAKATP